MSAFCKYLLVIGLVLLTSCGRQPAYQPLPAPTFSPLIVIDPGHGGKDEGCSDVVEEVDEKALTLRTAGYLASYLQRHGYRVYMTRQQDLFVTLEERAAFANDIDADYFVSIHFNAAESRKAKGVEVFYYDDKENERRAEESRELAAKVLEHIIAFTGRKSRGVKTANFRVIRKTSMPAILIEGGFLTNPEEGALCQKEEYINSLAYGIARGIDEYIKQNEECPRRELNARPVA